MIDCNTEKCKAHAVLTHAAYCDIIKPKDYKRHYCATCYIKLRGWVYEGGRQ